MNKCNCMNKKQKLSKPNPGGKKITSKRYIEELDLYSSQKNDVTSAFSLHVKSIISQLHVKSILPQLGKSPQPSISGLNLILINDSDDETDSDGESECCCVCGLLYPR
ncbi:hypothetical protein DPMN_109224 [Dreissena polymorpha]|uniref:Uncharacterized protein n=1 Tax=Dreissena polymorpha TaxID=45954 RepID=A0A9D4KAQ4_DREPO|nr:hypothetical protein DPMN_109224 [Dreissena polymorpha]